MKATKHSTEILTIDVEKHESKHEGLTTQMNIELIYLRRGINERVALIKRESDQNEAIFYELHRLITEKSE